VAGASLLLAPISMLGSTADGGGCDGGAPARAVLAEAFRSKRPVPPCVWIFELELIDAFRADPASENPTRNRCQVLPSF
jgi:hypothetical protein